MSDLEELRVIEEQIVGEGISHGGKEWVWNGRMVKLEKGEWERRACIRKGKGCDDRG